MLRPGALLQLRHVHRTFDALKLSKSSFYADLRAVSLYIQMSDKALFDTNKIIMAAKKTNKSEIDATAQDSDKLEVGRRIKRRREKFNWTLDELSQSTKQIDPTNTGVSKVSISRYENGDTYPGYREIKLIARALGQPIEYFFYGDQPDPYSGWSMSLDEYLRFIIKDVLIEEGLIEGVSINDKEMQKMRAMQEISLRRQQFEDDPDPKAIAEKEVRRLENLDRISKEVEIIDKKAEIIDADFKTTREKKATK